MINLSQSQQTPTLHKLTSRCRVKGAIGVASSKETKSKDVTYGGRGSMLTCPDYKSGREGEVKGKIIANIHGGLLLSTLQVSHLMFINYPTREVFFSSYSTAVEKEAQDSK